MLLMPPDISVQGQQAYQRVSSQRGNLCQVLGACIITPLQNFRSFIIYKFDLERSTLWPDVLSYEWLYSCVDSVF